jgi:orotate phosphoribosyltransferase
MSSQKLKGAFPEAARQIFLDSQAILENGHFVYISGEHGSGWIDKDVIYLDTDRIMKLSNMLAEAAKFLNAQVVCGPAMGGLVVSEWTGHFLEALSIFAEHDPTTAGPERSGSPFRGPFILRRGYDEVVKGKRVLIVDDIVNTGLSIRETVQAVRSAGGNVVGAACYISRGNVGAKEIGVDQYVFLLEHKIPSWPVVQCELCHEGVPINTRYAHGKEFLAAKK